MGAMNEPSYQLSPTKESFRSQGETQIANCLTRYHIPYFYEHPQILACCLGGDTENDFTQAPNNFQISRRVLEAVRTSGHIVVARSVPSLEKSLTLTIIDENRPRTVLCGPVTNPAETIDVLYLVIPEDRVPSDMVNFLQAVIRQVDFARRSLLFSETKAERQVLDKQLSMAREIQTKLTPIKFSKAPGLDIAVWYQPAMSRGKAYRRP